jgi:hypothetical protein
MVLQGLDEAGAAPFEALPCSTDRVDGDGRTGDIRIGRVPNVAKNGSRQILTESTLRKVNKRHA